MSFLFRGWLLSRLPSHCHRCTVTSYHWTIIQRQPDHQARYAVIGGRKRPISSPKREVISNFPRCITKSILHWLASPSRLFVLQWSRNINATSITATAFSWLLQLHSSCSTPFGTRCPISFEVDHPLYYNDIDSSIIISPLPFVAIFMSTGRESFFIDYILKDSSLVRYTFFVL